MKTLIIISSFVFLLVSCQSSDDNAKTLLNKIELTISNETFTVDFGYDGRIKEYMDMNILQDEIAKLKTREDLINRYKSLRPGFLPGYSSMWPDTGEFLFVKIEYMLAQECFSDRCDSKTRKEILRLVANFQKNKYKEYTMPFCTRRTGVFLMAVILVRERAASAKHIDAQILQQALSCLNNEMLITEDFSNSVVKSAENFLTDSNK
jgi:hypothetical protein